MAMIKCSECGHEISNKAAACPFCGAPVEKETVSVHIWRNKNLVSGKGIIGRVFIDDTCVGPAGNGVDYTVKVAPGTHQVTVESEVKGVRGSARSASETFVAGKRTVNIEIKTAIDLAAYIASGCDKLKPVIS